MGITAFIARALKGVAWGKVAGLAMEYGPALYKTARERLTRDEPRMETDRTAAETALHGRIERLEKLLVEQEGVIREQAARNGQLEETCLKLAGRIRGLRIVSAALAGVSIILALLLLGKA